MKPKFFFTAIIFIVAVVASLYFLLTPRSNSTQYITTAVVHENIENSVLASGILEATKTISVGAQVSGQVKKMYVTLGDQVKKGQLIAQIDSIRQENDLKSIAAALEDQMAQMQVKKANLIKLEAEYKRQKAMHVQDASE